MLDASAVVGALLDAQCRELLARVTGAAQWVAPAVIDAEVASALRGLVRSRQVSAERGRTALLMFARMPLERMLVAPLLGRIWDVRDRLSAYDACYVALAERLGGPLITSDEGMARASRAIDVAVVTV